MNTIRYAVKNGNGTIRTVALSIALVAMFLYPLANM